MSTGEVWETGAVEAGPMEDRAPTIIGRKLIAPPLREQLVPRPRLDGVISRLIDSNQVLLVSATAGAGKTTAVVLATRGSASPVAWLTVDEPDSAPGRLITYLEASLARVRPAVSGITGHALALGLAHSEVAGLLGEALGDDRLTLVVDELERIADSRRALAVLEALIRYSSPSIRFVLIGRCPTRLDTGGSVMRTVGETDLAFTTAEAAEVLALQGATEVDPERAVESTCGWVAGVLFQAWSAADHVIGSGGERDPLNGYLASQILGRLGAEEREFLITTSLLDHVTAQRAEALGQSRAGERLEVLRQIHLPATWEADGRTIRCHPRFREYLLECLGRRGGQQLRKLVAAHGRLLASEGHHEEATEALLRADALPEALRSAERAIEQVVERLDFAVAERWLKTLGTEGNGVPSELTDAALLVSAGQEQYRRGAAIADRLQELGERDRVARSSPRSAAIMAWCYFHVGRLDDTRAVLSVADDCAETSAAHYLLTLADAAPLEPPSLTGGLLDALVLRVNSVRGHLLKLTDLPPSGWARAVMGPWRISALRAAGRTEQAFALYDAARGSGHESVGLNALVAVELLIDLGRRDEAMAALRRGRTLIERSGSLVFEMQSRVLEAKLELRLNRDAARARAILDRLGREAPLAQYTYVQETVDTWHGRALLEQGQDEAARERLGRAVDGMLVAERWLDLATAGVYLAEAAWRTGDERLADRAADVALEAARCQGSNHLLLQALGEFPAVLSRRLDAETSSDSPWHEIGRALMMQGVALAAPVETTIMLQEFGTTKVLLDGDELHPRLGKAYEVLAYLAAGKAAPSREELLEALFGGRADESALSYLRQAIRSVRAVLPEGSGPLLENGRLKLDSRVRVVSESAQCEALIAEAARLQREERLDATLRALEPFGRGEYMPKHNSPWVEARREQLESITADARFEAAELAFAAGRYTLAKHLVDQVLRRDPFRESAWRLTMRVATAMGHDDGMIGAFRHCERALARIGTSPSAATRELLEHLRR